MPSRMMCRSSCSCSSVQSVRRAGLLFADGQDDVRVGAAGFEKFVADFIAQFLAAADGLHGGVEHAIFEMGEQLVFVGGDAEHAAQLVNRHFRALPAFKVLAREFVDAAGVVGR